MAAARLERVGFVRGSPTSPRATTRASRKKTTSALASVVGITGTTRRIEYYDIVVSKFPHCVCASGNFNTRFLGVTQDAESLAAETRHLGHERETVQAAL